MIGLLRYRIAIASFNRFGQGFLASTTDKARELLKWVPQVSLDQGLERASNGTKKAHHGRLQSNWAPKTSRPFAQNHRDSSRAECSSGFSFSREQLANFYPPDCRLRQTSLQLHSTRCGARTARKKTAAVAAKSTPTTTIARNIGPGQRNIRGEVIGKPRCYSKTSFSDEF